MSRKVSILLLVTVMVVSLLTACNSFGGNSESTSGETNSNTPTTEVEKPLLELTAFITNSAVDNKIVNNANDVVTPYVEEKFNIKLNQLYTNNDQSARERLNQWIATDSVPDIVIGSKDFIDYAISTGEFMEFGGYIDSKMPNVNKYFNTQPGNFWPRFMNDGKKYQIPQVIYNGDLEEYQKDPYSTGRIAWAIWAREDILAKLGYKFTPLDEIKKTTINTGSKPDPEDFMIEPAIDSPEKFYELLKQINALNLKIGSKPMIPFSSSWWSAFHFGSIFDFGHWTIDNEDGTVNGYVGSKEAKDYYKYLNKLYNEGLIDQDFFIHKDEQLQEKIASGRVAAGLYIPDEGAAIQSLQQINPDYKIRYIPYPKKDPNKGFYDIAEPAFWRIIIKKDFADPERIAELFNWSLSDEALNLLTWGPEEAGHWEMKDGKKVFKDKAMEDFILNGPSGTNKNFQDYGLGFKSRIAQILPSAHMGVPENPYWFTRSYPPNLNLNALAKSYFGGSGINKDGRSSYGDGGVNTTNYSNIYWSKFANLEIGKLLSPKTDSEFDAAWAEIEKLFEEEGKYSAAQADMEKWFEANGPK